MTTLLATALLATNCTEQTRIPSLSVAGPAVISLLSLPNSFLPTIRLAFLQARPACPCLSPLRLSDPTLILFLSTYPILYIPPLPATPHCPLSAPSSALSPSAPHPHKLHHGHVPPRRHLRPLAPQPIQVRCAKHARPDVLHATLRLAGPGAPSSPRTSSPRRRSLVVNTPQAINDVSNSIIIIITVVVIVVIGVSVRRLADALLKHDAGHCVGVRLPARAAAAIPTVRRTSPSPAARRDPQHALRNNNQ